MRRSRHHHNEVATVQPLSVWQTAVRPRFLAMGPTKVQYQCHVRMFAANTACNILTGRPARETALLQASELKAILTVLEEVILFVAPHALETEPTSTLGVNLVRANACTSRDGERIGRAVKPEGAVVQDGVPNRTCVCLVAEEIAGKIMAVLSRRGVVGVRANANV